MLGMGSAGAPRRQVAPRTGSIAARTISRGQRLPSVTCGCANLYSMRLTVPASAAGTRLDRFVRDHAGDTSRSAVIRWIREGNVRVNGNTVRAPARRVRTGETIDAQPIKPPPLRAEPEDIELEIVFEDDDIAVVDKPAGMVVHAGAGVRSGTLVNALLHRFGPFSEVPGNLRPGIVHRLDRFTSGVIAVAKNERSQRRLQGQFERREVLKVYRAAVEGVLPRDPHESRRLLRHGRPVMHGGHWWLRLEMPIRRDRRNRVRMSVSAVGRPALTDVRLVRAGSACSLVEARPKTGRTHQIRVHLSRAGHPVVGDTLYGARRGAHGAELGPRYLLHAQSLEFNHPSSGERVRFEASEPQGFRAFRSMVGI